jgi:hypothetical protein
MVAAVLAAVWVVTSTISGAPFTDSGSSVIHIVSGAATVLRLAKPAELIVVAPDPNGLSVVTPEIRFWKMDAIG